MDFFNVFFLRLFGEYFKDFQGLVEKLNQDLFYFKDFQISLLEANIILKIVL